jgi:hypothetical protein
LGKWRGDRKNLEFRGQPNEFHTAIFRILSVLVAAHPHTLLKKWCAGQNEADNVYVIDLFMF